MAIARASDQVGSSPRGRGTPSPVPRSPGPRRFIPARAGNTRKPPSNYLSKPVHPRAGGEHDRRRKRRVRFRGSSPRGRGTPHVQDDRDGAERFIPARAGNTRARPPLRPWRPVHPRAGGEHVRAGSGTPIRRGSSPRGRGTRRRLHGPSGEHRFIPARAGNTGRRCRGPPRTPVHPRAGGEHSTPPHARLDAAGSSPRGRGTPDVGLAKHPVDRFIPARAGNT